MSLTAGRVYAVPFAATAVAAQQDFFYVKPAADKVCAIEAIYLANVGIAADAGDAAEELWDIELVRLPATVTVGSGGAAVATPSRMLVNDGTATFTARTNDTTKATSNGGTTIMHADGINVRIPYVWMPPPEHRPMVANAEAITLRLNSTPTDSVTMNGTMIVRELP